MKQATILLFLSIILVSCSSTPPDQSNQNIQWVYQNGKVIEFPQDWTIQPTFDLFESILVEDDYGTFIVSFDSRSHQSFEEWATSQDNLQFTEIGNYRIYQYDITYTDEDVIELMDNNTEGMGYFVLAPDNTVLILGFAKTENLSERLETILGDIISSVQPIHETENVFGFYGGIALMVYPQEFEYWNSSGPNQPDFRSNKYSVSILSSYEINWVYLSDIPDDTPIDEVNESDLIEGIMRVAYGFNELPLQSQISRYETSITIFSNSETHRTYIFEVSNDLWFRMSFRRNDGEVLSNEDEAVILQMIDSILLNQRDSLHEPINLVIP